VAGDSGAGALFFSGCSLKCSFCQNRQISSEGLGRDISIPELIQIYRELIGNGAYSLDFVTGTHFIPSIVESLRRSPGSLEVPVVWNTSGFETAEALEMIDPFVDIYLPDLKTLDPDLADELWGAPSYPAVITRNLRRMAASTRKRLLIVRHLVLPGRLEATRGVLEWFASELKDAGLLSLMVQYLPVDSGQVKTSGRRVDGITAAEYDLLLRWLDEFGIEEGFVQEPEKTGGSGDTRRSGKKRDDWLPDFSRRNPFPAEYSEVVWHCMD